MRYSRKMLASKLMEVSKQAASKGQLTASVTIASLGEHISRLASSYYFKVQPGGYGEVPPNEYVEFDSDEEVIQYAADVVKDQTVPTFEIARKLLMEIGSFGEMDSPIAPNLAEEPEMETEDPGAEDPGAEPAPQQPKKNPDMPTAASLRTADIEGLEESELQVLREMKRKEDELILDLQELYGINPTMLYGNIEPDRIEPSAVTGKMEDTPMKDQLEALLRRANQLVEDHMDIAKKIFPKLPIRGDLPLRALAKELKKFGQDL